MNPLRFLRKPEVVVRDVSQAERHQIYLEEKARIEKRNRASWPVKTLIVLFAFGAAGYTGFYLGESEVESLSPAVHITLAPPIVELQVPRTPSDPFQSVSKPDPPPHFRHPKSPEEPCSPRIWISGYTRKNGTYVEGYWRSNSHCK